MQRASIDACMHTYITLEYTCMCRVLPTLSIYVYMYIYCCIRVTHRFKRVVSQHHVSCSSWQTYCSDMSVADMLQRVDAHMKGAAQGGENL